MIPHRIFIFEVTMKRFFSSLLILLLLVSLSASGCSRDGTPRFSRGARAFAVRLSDGGERAEREFFGFSPDDTVLPASVTKLVTALAALGILPRIRSSRQATRFTSRRPARPRRSSVPTTRSRSKC